MTEGTTPLAGLRARLAHQQPPQPLLRAFKAGVGGMLAIALVAVLERVTDSHWIMAPFGASCVLLFSVPASPLSQPVNLIGGHLLSTCVGLVVQALLPVTWWSMGLAVGLAIALMVVLRITHPPAGADPLVVLAESPGWDYLLLPVAGGSLVLVLVAWLVHRVPPRVEYPLRTVSDTRPERAR